DHAERRASSDLRALRRAVDVRAAHVSVLPERRPDADHVVCDARRPLPRVRVRRLQALSEGVRRAPREPPAHGGGRHDRHAAARRSGDAARVSLNLELRTENSKLKRTAKTKRPRSLAALSVLLSSEF